MLALHEVEKLLNWARPELVEIALELRNLVAEVAPAAMEKVYTNGLGYHHTHGGTVSAGICQILLMDDHVRLAFIHGADLPDPCGLLRADENRLAKRYARVERYDEAPWADLRALIVAAARFDPRHPGEGRAV